MTYNADVSLAVEFAFGHDPLATPTWTAVTSDVQQFSTRRGRSRVLDQMQASQFEVTLGNTPGDYSPWNTAGDHYPNVRVFTPARIRATHNAVTYDLIRGFAESWDIRSQPGGVDPTAVVSCIDGFRLLAMYEAELTESAEFSGTRINNLLDAVGWPAGWRAIDTGTHMVQALSAEFDSALNQIHRAVLVEQGLFYISGAGIATFKDGNTRIQDKSSPVGVFSDDGAGLVYTDLKVDYDDLQLWNEVTVTRVGGVAQTASDAPSISDYGIRDLHLSETMHVADGEARSLADQLLMEYHDIRSRVPEITLKPERDPAVLWPHVLGRELLDRVTVERTDVAGSALADDYHIEGVSHDVRFTGGRSWVTKFQLSPKLPFDDWWVLGTSELGTDTRLGY